MGRHSSADRAPDRAPNHVVARVVAALVVVILFAWGLVAVLKPDVVRPAAGAPCTSVTTLRIVTASSFAPVLADLAPQLARGRDCLRLEVSAIDGRPALGRLAAMEADVWIPDDAAWAMHTGDDVLAPHGQVGAHTILATSPIYMVSDQDTASRITAAGGSWAALSGLLTRDSGVRLVVRDPAGSGDGMVAVGSLGEAIWLTKGMDSATVASVAIQRVGRAVTGSRPALPSGSGEVGLVPEYALVRALDSNPAPLVVLTGTDRTAMLRFTWLPLAAAVADPDRRVALDRLLGALKSGSADQALSAAGLRRPDGEPPPGLPRGQLPRLAAKPFDEIAPHHVDHVFAAWYPKERRANLLLVVDVSGSMADPAAGTRTPLIRLVASGCASVGSLLPAESRLGLWGFGSRLDPPRDHRVLLQSAPLTPAHRRALSTVVGKLAAQRTGTGLYDTILAAYRSAVASYQPGMPNQVLIFTDALNEDDPGGITLAQLSTRLKATANSRRPVSVAVAAFGSKPDGGLKAALKPVKGSLVRVTSGHQVDAMFVHAAVGGLR